MLTLTPSAVAWVAAVVVAGAAVGRAWPPSENSAPRSVLRPPGWVFAVVWPALYASIGLALSRGGGTPDPWLLVHLAANLSWPWVRSRGGERAAAALVVGLAVHAQFLALRHPVLWPYAAWLVFASYLSLAPLLPHHSAAAAAGVDPRG